MAFALDIAARSLLLPVLVAQGMWCRKTARSLPDPPGPREGRAGDGAPLRMLILGDSSAIGVGCDHQRDTLSGQLEQHITPHRQLTWRVLARTGAQTADALRWLDHVDDGPYDVAVTCLGVNDVTGRVSRARWLAMQTEMVARLQGDLGARHLYVSGLPPVHQFPLLPDPLRWVLGRQAQRFNAGLTELLQDSPGIHVGGRGMVLSPEVMSPDGFHPGPPVYAEWARRIAGFLQREGVIPAAPAPAAQRPPAQ